MTDPREVARFMAGYAKTYHAGAFGTPIASDLAARPGAIQEWRTGNHRTVAVSSVLTRNSTRKDWAGHSYVLPAGSRVATHVARTPGAAIPDLSGYDYVYAYAEDHELTRGLQRQGRTRRATRISAASEVITCWGTAGERQITSAADALLVTEVPLDVPETQRQAIVAELGTVTGWFDDYPFYNRDGTWSSVSLRGFDPTDYTVGLKPAEMNRNWQAEHPGWETMACDWTPLADRMPSLKALIEGLAWTGGNMERVRLLRMAALPGPKPATLGRHSDITDRNSGLGNGQVARFHIPLVTHPDIKLHTVDLTGTHREHHLAAWSCYYLDARKPHWVENPTDVDRIHLVVDVLATRSTRQALGVPA